MIDEAAMNAGTRWMVEAVRPSPPAQQELDVAKKPLDVPHAHRHAEACDDEGEKHAERDHAECRRDHLEDVNALRKDRHGTPIIVNPSRGVSRPVAVASRRLA